MKHFSYLILDNDADRNVTISLQNKVGYFKFYAKIVQDYTFNSDSEASFPTVD